MNNNEKLPMMRRLLLVWVMVFGLGMPGWGQGMVDYAEFEVLGKRGEVTMVVKDNDYRMVVGKLKKPGAVFLLGYSREQAQQRFVKLLREIEKEDQTNQSRPIVFCGVLLRFTTSGTGEKAVYKFQVDDKKVQFSLCKKDLFELAELLD
jgi:hypothetical protein